MRDYARSLGSSFICAMEVRFICAMEVRLHGSSLTCDMEHRSLHGSCCMRVSVVRDV